MLQRAIANGCSVCTSVSQSARPSVKRFLHARTCFVYTVSKKGHPFYFRDYSVKC